jgi:hypothetical protein
MNQNQNQNQNHYLNPGDIIFVRVNNIPQPAVVIMPDENDEVLVRFINNNVVVSKINYRNLFGTNILIAPRASNYITYRLVDILHYTNLNLEELQSRYNFILDDIHRANRPAPNGGQRKHRSKLSNKRVKLIKRSRQRK